MTDAYQIVDIGFDELIWRIIEGLPQILDSRLKLAVFVGCHTPLVVSEGVTGIYASSIGQILDGFDIFAQLDIDHTALDQKLLTMRLLLQCHVRID